MAVFILINWILWTLVLTVMGHYRKIGSAFAFGASFFFSPLIGAVVVLSSTKKSTLEFQKKLLEAQQHRSESNTASDLEILEKNYKAGILTEEEYKNILKRMGK